MPLPLLQQNNRQALSTLLLEDDEFMSELTVDVLKNAGMAPIHVAFSAAQALVFIKQHQPDLLICDLAIPDTDGFEFLQKIAESHYTGAIIIVSGLAEAVVKAAHRVASAHGLQIIGAFAKPITGSALQTALDQLHLTDRNQS